MGIKRYKPTTPSMRFAVLSDFSSVTKHKPEKSLVEFIKSSGGRNVYGRVTVRHHGGGHKQLYRKIDFKRNKLDQPAKVIAIEYDPNRSANIALIEYTDGQKSYILAPVDLFVGAEIISSSYPDTELKSGNCLLLRHIAPGTSIHNIELVKGKGGQIVRGAGTYAQIMAKEGNFAQIRLPSSEIRMVDLDCRATIGQVGNVERSAFSIGKAGRSRWLGRRPSVRGSAMNPHDHPHGGGEGKAGQGNPHPVTPWGKPTKGYKTRKRRKLSDKFIVKRRS